MVFILPKYIKYFIDNYYINVKLIYSECSYLLNFEDKHIGQKGLQVILKQE